MKVLTILVSSLLVVQSCCAVDKEVKDNSIVVKVLGKSGKVLVRKKSKKESDAVVIEMDDISEYAADGTTKVGKSGRRKHSFNTFASQEFSITKPKRKTYQNLSATGFDFKTKIIDAEITITVTIFKVSGIILNDNEELEVRKGMVKTDIKISNWTFCNPCKNGKKNETGDNLQLTMTLKGRNAAPKMKAARNATRTGRKRAPSYDLGGNVTLVLSKKYKDDGTWTDMHSDYPKIATIGKKKSFVFRFEKFNNMVFYDPAVDVSESTDDDDPNSSGEVVKVSMFFMVFGLFINLVCGIF